jgi:transposase-like protein
VNTSEGDRRRRHHSAEFKARVVAACRKPVVSIAAVALDHPFLLRLRELRKAGIPSVQVEVLLVFPMPAFECVLRGVAELTNSRPDSFAQLDVEPYGSETILV